MDIPIIDLFSGAGGLGLGALKAGGDLRLSVEIDEMACETMRSNHQIHTGNILCEDVCNLSGDQLKEFAGIKRNDPFIIVGGPPCQPFSKASYWTDPGNDSRYRRARMNGLVLERPQVIKKAKKDERRSLIFEFFRLIKESKPDGILFENVPSILHPRNIGTFTKFRKAIEEIGYKTLLVKVNGQDFGIAQKRQRIILLGLQADLPSTPIKTHSDNVFEIHEGLLPYVTSGQALKKYNVKKYFEKEEIVVGKWANHLFEIPPGMNYKALTKWAGHKKPTFVAETRFWNFLLKLDPNLPSWTIAANPGPWTGPFHWNDRRLRTVELAVLQGFPDTYKFAGTRRDIVKQIGNALPSHIAEACLKPLVSVLNGTFERIAV
jgi:DNA (cytosine-5)-methyltransferase 1